MVWIGEEDGWSGVLPSFCDGACTGTTDSEGSGRPSEVHFITKCINIGIDFGFRVSGSDGVEIGGACEVEKLPTFEEIACGGA